MNPGLASRQTTLWTCPTCQMPLQLAGRQFRCGNGHCFDQAKEGYVNLLPVKRKGSALPGDAGDMLRSRREFLQQGHYRALADRLAGLCVEHHGQTLAPLFTLLDSGCGEGYYIGVIADALSVNAAQAPVWAGGIDIAKEAARMASRRYRNLQFAVASNAALPLPDKSIDCLLRIFAPAADAEVRRVLAPGGLFVSVTPGERHLFGLRRLVYDRPREHQAAAPTIEGLRHVRREALDYKIRLNSAGDAARLLAMTPYYWQASREKQLLIAALESIELAVCFRIDRYRSGA